MLSRLHLKEYEFKKGQKPWNYNPLFKNCIICNKVFKIKKSIANLRKTCSHRCAAEIRFGKRVYEKNRQRLLNNPRELQPNFKGGWANGRTPWLREEALKRDDFTCQMCGEKESTLLEVDHIKPIKHFPELKNELNNLQVLCKICHIAKTKKDRFLYC